MWQELLGGGTEQVQVAAGKLVFPSGQEPRIALILSGVVRVFIVTPEGRQLTTRYARTNDLCGLGALMAGIDGWNAEAIADTIVAMVTIERVRSVAARDPKFAWGLTERLAAWASEPLATRADSASKPMTARIAGHLLEVALPRPDGRAVAHISHQRLADAVGTVREVISRELRTLRAQGVIDTGPELVVVIDQRRLERSAGGTPPGG